MKNLFILASGRPYAPHIPKDQKNEVQVVINEVDVITLLIAYAVEAKERLRPF
jgi:hypothetical protein